MNEKTKWYNLITFGAWVVSIGVAVIMDVGNSPMSNIFALAMLVVMGIYVFGEDFRRIMGKDDKTQRDD